MTRKILSAQQVKWVDAYTIEHNPVTSLELMEHASRQCVEAFVPYLTLKSPVHVFCGPGNNGGDGLAIARILRKMGYDIQAYCVVFGNPTPECIANKERLSLAIDLKSESDIPVIKSTDIVIDALLGVGTSRRPEGILKSVIERINESKASVLSVDLPSGLPADSIPDHDVIIRATVTATFQQPKLVFFLKETLDYAGEWKTLQIGLNEGEIERQATRYYHIDAAGVEKLVIPRARFSHKGTYGHGLLLAGSKGKMGSAVLAARSALRSGIGLLTVHIPGIGLDVLQTAVPEAMCEADPETGHISEAGNTSVYSAIGIGPGLGKEPDSLLALKAVLQSGKPVVIDADALNLLSENQELLEILPEKTILTPHPLEFERLAGASSSSTDRLERLIHFAQTYKCTVVLKDAITAIATRGGQVFFNTTGNPGMATGGTGDVLTGILLGLLAQHYEPEAAAQIAVYHHGLAGDKAAAVRGQNALIAGDLVDYLRIGK